MGSPNPKLSLTHPLGHKLIILSDWSDHLHWRQACSQPRVWPSFYTPCLGGQTDNKTGLKMAILKVFIVS